MVKKHADQHEIAATLQESVTHYLDDRFSCGSLMAALDDPSLQRVIARESSAKIALAIASDDAAEFTYQNLIREIDKEANFGIFLASPAGNAARLRRLDGDTGEYGKLHELIARIAPVMFAEEYFRSGGKIDEVLVAINSRYDQANLEAEVSELLLIHLLDDEDEASDRTDELRALFYACHEEQVRRRLDLPPAHNERAVRRLADRIRNLTDRAGDYAERVAAIREHAGTA